MRSQNCEYVLDADWMILLFCCDSLPGKYKYYLCNTGVRIYLTLLRSFLAPSGIHLQGIKIPQPGTQTLSGAHLGTLVVVPSMCIS